MATMPRKLGLLNAVALFGGILTLLATSSFLGFLWFGDSNSLVWRAIVLNGWLIRTITIISFVIRTMVAMHLVTCVSMLAALALELGQVPLASAPGISMMRFQNGGPTGLLSRFYPAMNNLRGTFLGLAITVLVVIELASQLTSTALLSDISSGFIRITSVQPALPYAVGPRAGPEMLTNGVRPIQSGFYLHSNPPFPTFGEYDEAPTDPVDGIADTGFSVRALFPIASASQRTLLREYTGPANLFDLRVVCVRPDPGLTKLWWRYGDTTRPTDPAIMGHVASSLTPSRFIGSPSVEFDIEGYCSYATPLGVENDSEWPVTLCAPRSSYGENYLVSGLERFPTNFNMMNPKINDAYLLINTTGAAADWNSIINSNAPKAADWLDLYPDKEEKEWFFLKTNTTPSVGFSISLCYSAIENANVNIHATTAADKISEPSVAWNITSRSFNTTSARLQASGTVNSPDRAQTGVFDLSAPPSWMIYSDDGPAIFNRNGNDTLWITGMTVQINPGFSSLTLALCSNCDCQLCEYRRDNVTRLNAVQSAVVNDILGTTRNAAKAVQGLLGMVATLTYYDTLELFSLTAEANMVSDVVADRPVGKAFFTTVMVFVGVHIVMVVGITGVFLSQTRYTMLGNAWVVMKQLRGKEVEEWRGGSKLDGDVEMKKEIDLKGEGRVLVGLEREGGAVLLRRKT